jgi:hypothetical protein
MTESAVLDEPRIEAPPAPSISVSAEEEPKPRRKQKRFLTNLRANGLRYLVLTTALLSAWGLIQAALWEGPGSPEATFMLALAGGLLAAGAKTAIDILNWADATRQATHIERVRAIERVFARAGAVREHAALDWRRMHTVLVDNLSGSSQEIRLFRDHDETDRRAEALLKKAYSEELWIRADGVDAVRRFKRDIGVLNYDALQTEWDFLAAFNAHMNDLRRDLALAALGIPLD